MSSSSAISATDLGVTNTAAAATGLSAANSTQDQFLKLFVAQLKYQDPMSPQSNSDMVAQLAQFSSVEQQVQTNANLTTLTKATDASGSAALSALVGKSITASVNSLKIDGTGGPPPISVVCDSTIKSGVMEIKDSNGVTVKQINFGPGNGPFALSWNGTNPDGTPVPAGTYSLKVTTTAADGTAVNATPEISGTATKLELDSDGNYLRIGNALVTPAEVISIGGSTTGASS